MVGTKRLLLILSLTLSPWVNAQEQPVVLKARTILDGRGKVVQNAIIVVEGGKIARIGGAMPRGAITYDLTGLTVTPEWIDAHDHIRWHFHNGRVSAVGVEHLPPMKGAAGVFDLMAQHGTYYDPNIGQQRHTVTHVATSHATDWIIAAASVGHYDRIAAADSI